MSIHREEIVPWGTKNVRFPSPDDVTRIISSVGNPKRVWIWTHNGTTVAKTNNRAEIQLHLESIGTVHDGTYRLYDLPPDVVPHGAAPGSQERYSMDLKVSHVYRIIFDNQHDKPLRLQVPRAVEKYHKLVWFYYSVPSVHAQEEALSMLQEMFNLESKEYLDEFPKNILWRLYGMYERKNRWIWNNHDSRFLDSDGLPPKPTWPVFKKTFGWEDIDKMFKDSPMDLYALKRIMMPFSFQEFPDTMGDLTVSEPVSGIYVLMTKRNAQETTPYVIQAIYEVQMLNHALVPHRTGPH